MEPVNALIDGEAVRRRRKDAGLSQVDLAERAEISSGYLSQIETGARPSVSPATWKQLAAALNCAGTEIGLPASAVAS